MWPRQPGSDEWERPSIDFCPSKGSHDERFTISCAVAAVDRVQHETTGRSARGLGTGRRRAGDAGPARSRCCRVAARTGGAGHRIRVGRTGARSFQGEGGRCHQQDDGERPEPIESRRFGGRIDRRWCRRSRAVARISSRRNRRSRCRHHRHGFVVSADHAMAQCARPAHSAAPDDSAAPSEPKATT